MLRRYAVVATDRLAIGGVLVVGGGYAGSLVARALGECTIVNPDNHMLFRPLLAEAASGAIEPRHVVVPLRMMCPRAELILGEAVAIDHESRSVTVRTEGDTYVVRYWNLVIALGSVARALPVPGLAEHALGFNDLADAITLRNHVLRELEAADAEIDRGRRDRHLGFVFVGAGYAGTEGLAELKDLVRSALRYYPRLRDARQRWVLVEARERILPEVTPGLAAYTARLLERRGVEIKTQTRLESIDAERAVLSDGTDVETHTLVWTAGVRPNPMLEEWNLPLDERGSILVDESLRVRGHTDIWALGDCASVPNQASGATDPPTSQHALRQARALARNLRGKPRAYRYRMIGQGATLGLYKGIAEIFGLRFRGFLGWFATRTYHLYQLPLFSRKLRVVTDWTIALLFRRDIAELGSLGHPRRLEP
jgi:NADH dehydrogenase